MLTERMCRLYLLKHLVAIMVTRQITGNLKEVFVPLGQTRFKQVYLSLRADGLPSLKKQDETASAPSPVDDPSITAASTEEEANENVLRSRQATGVPLVYYLNIADTGC